MTRKQQLAAVWRNTPKDYRGRRDGVRCILVLRNGGTTSVPLDDLTDAEISDRLPKPDDVRFRTAWEV